MSSSTGSFGAIMAADAQRRRGGILRAIGDNIKEGEENKAVALKNAAGKDTEIDEVTRTELVTALNAPDWRRRLRATEKAFAVAKEGVDPKIKSRLGIQKLFEATVESPDAQRLRGNVMASGSLLRL